MKQIFVKKNIPIAHTNRHCGGLLIKFCKLLPAEWVISEILNFFFNSFTFWNNLIISLRSCETKHEVSSLKKYSYSYKHTQFSNIGSISLVHMFSFVNLLRYCFEQHVHFEHIVDHLNEIHWIVKGIASTARSENLLWKNFQISHVESMMPKRW